MKSIYRSLSVTFFALAALLESSAQAQTITFSNAPTMAIPRRASIILIVANGLGYGDLSCYGQTKFQTPNLDKLATDGVRFTNFFCQNDATKSQAEFVFGNNSSAGELPVAQVLKNAGYHTGLIGEWKMGDENSADAPWRKGFDEFAGYLNERDAENFYADYIFRYDPKGNFDETNNTFSPRIAHEMIYANTQGKNLFIPDVLAKAACNFIKNNVPDDFNHHQPFFLLLNLPIPGDGSGRPPSDAPFSDETWPQAEKNKAAMISRLDDCVAQIRQQLQQLGMTNNAAIFFTSDSIAKKANGVDPKFFQSNANDLRVPMIAFWPDGIPAGRVSGLKWSGEDFLPTAAEIGYAKTPEKIEGKSILPSLK